MTQLEFTFTEGQREAAAARVEASIPAHGTGAERSVARANAGLAAYEQMERDRERHGWGC